MQNYSTDFTKFDGNVAHAWAKEETVRLILIRIQEFFEGILPLQYSSSSSDCVDIGGPLRQPGMPTTEGPEPFSADAERGTVRPSPICCIHE